MVISLGSLAAFVANPAYGDLSQINQSVIVTCGDHKGAGFFLSSGDVVTAKHVVKGCKSVGLVNNSQAKGSGVVAFNSAKDDIAIITGSTLANPSKNQPLDPVKVSTGEQVTVVGSPIDGLVLSQGKVLEPHSIHGDRTMTLEVPADHGNSGGPVFSDKGVIGLVIGKTSEGQIIALNAESIQGAIDSLSKGPRLPASKTNVKNGEIVLIQDNSAPKLQLSLIFNGILSGVIVFMFILRKKRFSRKKIVINFSNEK